jgi:hypothetical protein
MQTEITTTQAPPPPALGLDQAARGTERLRHLLPSLSECPAARDEVARILPILTSPAEPAWLMARIGALLAPYYEKDVPQSFREIEAEDWAAELGDIPRWALTAAVRWWKSSDNPDRRKRPLEGDIKARVQVEMQAVRAAEIKLSSPCRPPAPEAAPAQRATPDEARSALLGAGFRIDENGKVVSA